MSGHPSCFSSQQLWLYGFGTVGTCVPALISSCHTWLTLQTLLGFVVVWILECVFVWLVWVLFLFYVLRRWVQVIEVIFASYICVWIFSSFLCLSVVCMREFSKMDGLCMFEQVEVPVCKGQRLSWVSSSASSHHIHRGLSSRLNI